MDEINDFFDFSKDFEKKTVPRGCVSGSALATAGKPQELNSAFGRRDYVGTSYAKSLIEQECLKLDELDLNKSHHTEAHSTVASSCMDDLEPLSTDSENDDEENPRAKRPDDGIYDRYPFDLNRNSSLPIYDKRDEIVEMIRTNPVVVLEGDTGCGKTTQVPQYILDDAYTRREYCKIVVTQPRRIAAITIARRVCQERKWQEGTLVGYQVGLHANLSEDTRLLYCTTGVLLQKLVREKSLGHFTHIILDEVHERDQEMDFLLIVVRRLLATTSKHVKIILMSATINTNEFANYFRIRREPAPIIKADSRRRYKVSEFYLCELGRINNSNIQIDYAEPGISNEMYGIALKLIYVIDNIEKHEAPHAAYKTSILIFLPGINEIDKMCRLIEDINDIDDNTIKLSPIRLHSLISPDEQLKIFHQAPPGYRKVILSTNIAESSVTVPDVKYVIDFCLTKSLVTDSASNFSCLQLHWASKANCRQRSGRAGRVMNGRVYRLVPRYYYDNCMNDYSVPEMLRCPLENVVLRAKLLDMGPPPDILGLAMNPPNLSDIHNTILMLKELGALYMTVNGTYSVQDGDISFMGRIMAALPLDVRLSRLIVLGYIFGVLDDAVIMAAGLSVRSVFQFQAKTPHSDCEAYIKKLSFADGSGSDLFAMLKAYKLWSSMCEQNNLRDDDAQYAWANRCHLNIRSLKEMHLLRQEILERLEGFNLKTRNSYQHVHWMDREKTTILKIVIAGAFYPNYFTRTTLNDTDRERGLYHILCGNDPCSTVYFTNFNTKHIGQLYAHFIKDIFRDLEIGPQDIEVRFQPGSEKVLVTFKNDLEKDYDESSKRLVVPGRVRPEVYKAIRMRMSKMRTVINVMDPRMAVKYAEDKGYGAMIDGVWQPVKNQIKHPDLFVLPSVFQKKLKGRITHIENCGKFFFLPITEKNRFNEMLDILNDEKSLDTARFKSPAEVAKGMILCAPLNDRYQRAMVLKISSTATLQFKVLFIDNGSTAFVRFEQLRAFWPQIASMAEIPPRIFECRLAMIEPSTVRSPNGKWSEETKELLQECADTGVVEIEIFSVVEAVANIIINIGNTTFNDLLVERKLARSSDENYLSKSDHDNRQRQQALSNRYLDEDQVRQKVEYLESILPKKDKDIPPPPLTMCNKMIRLRGPFSPLETKIFSTVRAGSWKSVEIERDSVNSVLLDTDPQDVHERLYVAAGVTATQSGETIVARATTLMPNIHGFGALMTMLFCPTMQIKRNSSCTKYVAILAGLGYNPTNYKPLYAEHDVVLNLDVEIKTEDFEMINQLRYCMDSLLFTDIGEEKPTILPKQIGDLQAKIKQLIIKLLSKNRKYIETHVSENDNVWLEHDSSEILETVAVLGDRSLFPMLPALVLRDEQYDKIQALLLHCDELHRLAQFGDTVKPLTCRLCNQYLENVMQIRIHLLSQLHRDGELKIRYKPKK
ncbi:probable ATP-dependent RNA helicase spindle-E [Musca domestica]|uniref:Probable ATP-dependent RNA helicase spindle-E n=1 Tax=Musca domestica TaxID=7370 RepID=A0A1I8N4W6_MUSDO|nr:probable ATP-dependent RNA helicase spindle-E [Musca domestica]